MFCPKCGKADQAPETYCRQCGTFLADFTKKKKQFSLGGDTPQEQIRTNLVLNSMSAVVSLASALILYAVFWNRGGEFPAQTEVHQTNPLNEFPATETKKILPEADLKDSIPLSVTENTTKTLNKIPRR
jgi:uncharacterized membrane protein YvbJ